MIFVRPRRTYYVRPRPSFPYSDRSGSNSIKRRLFTKIKREIGPLPSLAQFVLTLTKPDSPSQTAIRRKPCGYYAVDFRQIMKDCRIIDHNFVNGISSLSTYPTIIEFSSINCRLFLRHQSRCAISFHQIVFVIRKSSIHK